MEFSETQESKEYPLEFEVGYDKSEYVSDFIDHFSGKVERYFLEQAELFLRENFADPVKHQLIVQNNNNESTLCRILILIPKDIIFPGVLLVVSDLMKKYPSKEITINIICGIK